MPDVQRRIILKPAGVNTALLARLAEALADAVELQNRLADKSPHVLRLTSSLQQNDAGFFVAHEPAVPLDPAEIFHAGGPALTEERLLHFANGLFEALAAAHASGGARPGIHGGLCPGVVLTGKDGLVRVADFGIAPAICKVLGTEPFLNVAVGPRPDACGAWELVAEHVADRDDRLCGFVDPDKYGQDTFGSFEPGSDIIAAAMVLYVLAERKHPYLYYEAEAHRDVNMARMMSFGVPIPIRRKDLCESASPGVRACCELVAAMLARAPGERPAAAEVLRRFRTAAPGADLELITAQRWVTQIESLLQQKAWRNLQAALQDRPNLKTWPQDLLSRAVSVERQAQDQLARLGEQAAIEADRLKAEAWLARVQGVMNAGDWKAARSLLAEQPELKHWPAGVLAEIKALSARVDAEEAAEKARAWQKSLQKAFTTHDWTAVARRFEQRPPPESCPPDVAKYAAEVEAEYQKYLEEQERRQRLIEQQHREADAWLNQARHSAKDEKWVETLDWLAQPPRLEHWPAGCREAARRLMEECRLHLGDVVQEDLGKIEEIVCGHGDAVVQQLLATRFAELLRPACVETKIELVVWAPPETDADGRATLLTRVRAPRGLTEPEALRGALDFKLRGLEPHISAGLEEFRRLVETGLDKTLRKLQALQLGALERALRDSVFPEAALRAQLDAPTARAAAEIHWLGIQATEGRTAAELSWDGAALAWQVADAGALSVQAVQFAAEISARALRADLLSRCELARQHAEILSVAAEPQAPSANGGLPKSLLLATRILLAPDGGAARPVYTGNVTVRQVRQATFGDAVRDIESKLTRQLIDAQTDSLGAVTDNLKRRLQEAPIRVDVSAPKRSKTPTPTLRFELKPKGGTAVACDAVWNPRTFAYELTADATRAVNELLKQLGWVISQEAAAAEARQTEEAARKAEEARRKAEEATARKAADEVRKAEEARRKAEEAAARQAEAKARQADEVAARQAETEARKTKEDAARRAEAEAREAQEVQRKAAAQARQAEEAESKAAAPARQLDEAKRKAAAAPSQEPPKPAPQKSRPPPAPPKPASSEPKKPAARKRRAVFLVAGLGAAAFVAMALFFVLHRGPSDQTPRPPLSPQPPTQPGPSDGHDSNAFGVDNNKPSEPQVPGSGAPGVAQHSNPGAPLGGQPPATSAEDPNATRTAEVPAPKTLESQTTTTEEKPSVTEAEERQAKLKEIQEYIDKAKSWARSGELVAAHNALGEASTLADELGDVPGKPDLDALEQSLPRAWAKVEPDLRSAGYPRDGDGTTDQNTGYPSQLRSSDGRVLVLVSVAPADKLWAELEQLGAVVKASDPLHTLLKKGNDQRPWHLFYIAATVRPVPKPTANSSAPLDLPTRDEWFLAALKNREKPLSNLSGGLWEWCTDESAESPGKRWVCGGCRQLLKERLLPPKTTDLGDWWKWLTNPLVMQQRPENLDEDLIGVRTVLPIPPPK